MLSKTHLQKLTRHAAMHLGCIFEDTGCEPTVARPGSFFRLGPGCDLAQVRADAMPQQEGRGVHHRVRLVQGGCRAAATGRHPGDPRHEARDPFLTPVYVLSSSLVVVRMAVQRVAPPPKAR